MRWPLRNQIMWPLLAVATASLLAVGAGHAWLSAGRTRSQVERQLSGVAGVLAASNFPLTDAVLAQMRRLCGAEFVLVDETGTIRASSWEPSTPTLPEGLPKARTINQVAFGQAVVINGRSYFPSAVELQTRFAADRSQSAGILYILFPRDQYLRAWREAFIPPLIVGVAALAAAAAVANLVAGRISRATSRLGGEVERLATGDYDVISLPQRDDELRDLTAAVNRTAVKLADYEREVRRTEQIRTLAILGAGLAHELRNSATGCRMALDLHAEGCSQAVNDESMAVARQQLVLMENLLQRFLRLGQPGPSAARRAVDLRELVEELLPLVQPAARHADVAMAWTPRCQSAMVFADPAELNHALLNLMLNALEAGQRNAAGGEVDVELAANSKTATLTVADNGPGPGEAVADSLFEPFVTTKPEGAGLGLAVTRQIAESLGGAVSWSRTAGVTRFELCLPSGPIRSEREVVHAADAGRR